MKNLIYHLLLLILAAILSGAVIGAQNGSWPAGQRMALAAGLALFTVALVLASETNGSPEQRQAKQAANRTGFAAATAVVAIGVISEVLSGQTVNYWLLIALLAATLSKIIALVFANSRRSPLSHNGQTDRHSATKDDAIQT